MAAREMGGLSLADATSGVSRFVLSPEGKPLCCFVANEAKDDTKGALRPRLYDAGRGVEGAELS